MTTDTLIKVPLWHNPDHVMVMDGTINASVIETFTRGMCHALAGELERLAGWDIVALMSHTVWYPTHFGALREDGRIVDINGLWEPYDWAHQFDGMHWMSMPKIDYHHPWASREFIARIEHEQDDYEKALFDIAEPYARLLIEEYR